MTKMLTHESCVVNCHCYFDACRNGLFDLDWDHPCHIQDSFRSCWYIKFCARPSSCVYCLWRESQNSQTQTSTKTLSLPISHSVRRRTRSNISPQCGSSIGWQSLLTLESFPSHLWMERFQVSKHICSKIIQKHAISHTAISNYKHFANPPTHYFS